MDLSLEFSLTKTIRKKSVQPKKQKMLKDKIQELEDKLDLAQLENI